MRNTQKRGNLETLVRGKNISVAVLQLDVTDAASITNCINKIIEKEGRIDVLINNAGAGMLRPLELAAMEEIQQAMDVNFYGPLRCIQAVLPHMRNQKSGHIINISSVGGLVGQPLNELYCAAKFALEGLSESIATYLKPYFNISVSLIEPGGIITEFSNTVVRNLQLSGGLPGGEYETLSTDYLNYRSAFTDEVKARVFQTPEQVAQVILQCISDTEPQLRYLTSDSAKEFTSLKTGLDPTGEKLQKAVRNRILNK